MWLNGKVDEIKPGGRLATCIGEMRKLRAEVEAKNPDEPNVICLSLIYHRRTLINH